MVNWPIGLSTGCFYRQSIFDCLYRIRESGFSLLEICFSPSHLDYHDLKAVGRAASMIQDLGMEAYSFHAPFAPEIDISALDANRRSESLAEILRAVEAAALLNVRYFVIHPGPESNVIPPHEERLERMEAAVSVLDEVNARCRQLGIFCVFENKLPHLLFGRTSDILWILDAVSSTDVGACLDTGHAALSGDLPNLLKRLSGHLRMIHAHDNNGHRDDHLTPGDGIIDWPSIVTQLEQDNFQGAVILEIRSESDPVQTMEAARRGRSFLRHLGREVR